MKKIKLKKSKQTEKKAKKKYLLIDDKLDPEEQELADSIERGEWKTVDNLEEELAFAKRAAANFLRKDARVTLRLSQYDLNALQHKAAKKGLPYQTYIASILHQFVAGDLAEKAA